MKKTLIVAAIAALMVSSSMANAATTKTTPEIKSNVQKQEHPMKKKEHNVQRPNLYERLNMTEAQKSQAHELRMKGHEKIKPVEEKIKAKYEEIRTVAENTTLTQEQKDKKIFAIEKELLSLKQQARKIRTTNMKQFEALLTEEQKAEFEKIKQEAQTMRKNGPHGPFGPCKGPREGKSFDGNKGPRPIEK